MKRWFSIALALALFGTTAVDPALSEETEIIVEGSEATVVELAPTEAIDLALYDDGSATEQPAEEFVESLYVGNDAEVAEMGVQPEENAVATGFQLSATEISIGVKEKYSGLTATALPAGAALPEISWRSSNKKIAKVNASTGVITGVKKGTATIYATAQLQNGTAEVACQVNVLTAPKKIAFAESTVYLGIRSRFQLVTSVPDGYGSGTRLFSSSNTDVATVDEYGVVTGLSKGKATITVKTFNGKKATCKVRVLGEPASIEFPDSILPLAIKETAFASAIAKAENGTVIPADFTYTIDRNSPDPGCIRLDGATGQMTGVREGQAVIRATAYNGLSATCTVEVDVTPASIQLSADAINIGVGEVYVSLVPQLVAPTGAVSCAQTVEWSSSNKKVATVDADSGAITGIKKGHCTITATTPNGKSASCKVKVLKAPTKKTISISPANGALKVGETGMYKVTFSSGYGGSLTYESSDPSIATVDNTGVVTALSAGTCKIYVTTYNGIKKTATLEVTGSGSGGGGGGEKSGNEEKIQYVLQVARSRLGKPYVYGGFGPDSFDCSGFVYWCYMQIDIKLKDSAYRQGYDERFEKISYENLKPGDVVIFNTVKDKDLSDHTGIFLGNGEFIHASSSGKKVMISNMTSGYYQRNFSWGRRILN